MLAYVIYVITKEVDIMAIDSHMHINTTILQDIHGFIEDINRNNSIKSVINVSLNIESSKESVLISEENPKFYSSVGIHPLYIDSQDVNYLYKLADSDKVVAIGEIGLDNLDSNFDEQKNYLIKQIIIANELHLPVIIHSNNSNKVVIEIFENYVKPKYGCVFHCFQPDVDDLRYLVASGYFVSFSGRITYKNAKKSLEIARIVPNSLFLVETDSPYISPEPYRSGINKSSNIYFIIKRIAEIKETSYGEIERITEQNAKRLFKKIK